MNFSIILIGGLSKRFATDQLKQFTVIDDKELFEYSLHPFLVHPMIDEVILVVPEDYIIHVNEILKHYPNDKQINVVHGGVSRQQSVYNALKHLYAIKEIKEHDQVIIHDGARPLVNTKDIDQVLKALKDGYLGVSLGLSSTDTLISLKKDQLEFLDRKSVFRLQTPQGFNLEALYQAHTFAFERGIYNATDDLQILRLKSDKLILKEGREENFKITTIHDLALFKSILHDNNNG